MVAALTGINSDAVSTAADEMTIGVEYFFNFSMEGQLNDTNDSRTNNDCDYSVSSDIRVKFGLLVVVTPIIYLLGLCANSLSIWVFTRPHMRCPNNWYLTALATSDILILSTAVALYTVEVLIDYYNIFSLAAIWYSYIRYVYTLSHICQVASIYLTVGATVERWIAMARPKSYERLCGGHKTSATILLVVVASVAFCLIKYWEFEVQRRPQCDNLAHFYVILSPTANTQIYQEVYSVWLTSLFTCLVPFVLLLIMNTIIIVRMGSDAKKSLRDSFKFPMEPFVCLHEQRRKRQQKKEANKVLVVVVFVFLICNFPGVILSLMEHIDMQFLSANPSLYGFFKDSITILAMVNAAVNILIYIGYARDFRQTLKDSLRAVRDCICQSLLKMLKGRQHKCVVPNNHQCGKNCSSATWSLITTSTRGLKSTSLMTFAADKKLLSSRRCSTDVWLPLDRPSDNGVATEELPTVELSTCLL